MKLFYDVVIVMSLAMFAVSCGNHAHNAANPFEGTDFVKIFEAGEAGCHTYRIPTMVRTQKGTLLAFCEARQNWSSDFGDNDIVLKRSFDDGCSWSLMTTVWDHGTDCLSNPTPVVLNDGGILLICHLSIGSSKENCEDCIYALRSDDDGQSWSEPRKIPDDQVKKEEWISSTVGPVHAIQLKHGEHKGRIIVPCYHKWYDENGVKLGAGHLIYSDDNGQRWTIGAIATSGNESTVAEMSDGTIIYNMREFTRYDDTPLVCRREVCYSYDGGETFSDVKYDDALIEPVCQGSLLVCESREGEDWMLFSNPASFKGRMNLQIKLSKDNGATWQSVYKEPYTFGAYSDMVILSDGSVGLIYEGGNSSGYEAIYYDIVPVERLYSGPNPEPVTVFEKGDGAYLHYRIPNICLTKDGTLLAFCEGRTEEVVGDYGDIDVVMKRSSDFGKTWSEGVVVAENGVYSCDSPVCGVLEDGKVVLLVMKSEHTGGGYEHEFFKYRTFVLTSDDNGISWSEPRDITDSIVSDGDYYMFTVGPCRLIQLKHGHHKGRILAGGYGKWFDWNDTIQPRHGHAFFVYSDDEGRTWHKGQPCIAGNESAAAELSNGDILLNMRQFTISGIKEGREYRRIIAVSRDGGETIGEPFYDPLLQDPVCNASLIRYNTPCQTGEDWLLFGNPDSSVGRMNFTVKLSRDCGRSWEAVYREPYTLGGYSALVQLPDGSVGVIYEGGEDNLRDRIVFDVIPAGRIR